MRFTHFYTQASYVIEPSYHEIRGVNKIPVRGLRVKFRDHTFDTQHAQKSLGWSDETRERVEQFLLNHKDLGQPRGLHLDVTETQPGAAAAKARPAKVVKSCAFVEEVDGQTHVCGTKVKRGSDYCARHDELVSAAVGGVD